MNKIRSRYVGNKTA